MGFLDRLNEITKPKLITIEFDFGDGPETVHVRALSAADRQRIIQDRLMETKITTKDSNGQEVQSSSWQLDFLKEGTTVNAELLATCLVNPDGKRVATKEAIEGWDSVLVQRLGQAVLVAVQKELLGGSGEGDGEDPSKGQS